MLEGNAPLTSDGAEVTSFSFFQKKLIISVAAYRF
jgi:hypothetical protein